ncbi:MAG: TIGR02444 family protein [Halioglobus sp.]
MENIDQNPLWTYSLEVYQREGVAPLCLQCQDRFGCDVNLLLYGGWLAVQGLALTPEHLARIDAGVDEWRQRVVRPLRALRRELRGYAAAEDIRARISAVELDAEQQQQLQIYRLHQASAALPGAGDTAEANLALIVQQGAGDHASAGLVTEWAEGQDVPALLRNLARLIAV